jgi:FixJ family two-component response regulator
VAYKSAEAALADPGLSHADCLMVDVQLSGMNCFALRDRLLREGIQTPCRFITAHADHNSLEWTRSLANHPCIVKPFDEAQLLAAIQGLLTDRSVPSNT